VTEPLRSAADRSMAHLQKVETPRRHDAKK